MKVKIISVHNAGDEKNEYVLLRALADCQIGQFILADSTYTKTGRVSNKLRHSFWFPDKEIKKDDYVSVWTGKGEDTITTTNDGNPLHRFYWGLETSIWNNDGDCAVLMHVDDWSSFKVPKA